jgi:hypothetical protein
MNVRLLVWGLTEADAERAVRAASLPQSRATWTFDIERFITACCLLDMEDPAAIAEETDRHWAYVAYRLNRAATPQQEETTTGAQAEVSRG